MRTTWTFHTATQLLFGRDAVKQLGEIAERLKAKKALIVTDQILVKAGLVERLKEPLTASGITSEVFSGGEPEPSFRVAEACLEVARKYQPDVLIALGGGSNMDLAKIVAVVLGNGGNIRDYPGDDKIPGPVWPLICVPTTAGTGSEVSAATVLTDTDNKMKVGILSNYLRPRVALVDPMLTVSCPPKVTADSGIDALTHAIEAYTAVDNAVFPLPPGEKSCYQGKHPLGDVLAEKAITLVGQHLRRAVANGKDLEAREGMALAATLAGMAFSNVGVAAVHAMEYPVGGAVHCSHGCGNGLLLPWVMRFNLPARVPEFARIATLLGEDVKGLSEQAAAERAVTVVDKLRADIGIPARLREIGVKQEQLKGFAEKAHGIRRVMRVNPRPLTVEDVEDIYLTAF
ncbi:MAG TPA: iron-containing alcohol dehydrogenase [Gemmataceae bacterium]|nr:iron-containing alcohol dehydrogenase [Gemmataceae bacterium]